MIFYFRNEKDRVERKRIAEASKGVGRPKVGGEFELLDHDGRPFGDRNMKGGFSLVRDYCILESSRGDDRDPGSLLVAIVTRCW